MQKIVGWLLYYAREVEPIMPVTLGNFSSNQTNINETIDQSINILLDYCSTHSNAIIRFKKTWWSAFTVMNCTFQHIRPVAELGGVFFFWGRNILTKTNGAIITISQINWNVMVSASEAECAALFINSREAIWVRTTL